MFKSKFVEGGYAVSFQGFEKIVQRSEKTVLSEAVETDVRAWTPGSPTSCTPGASRLASPRRTKVLEDKKGEYLQWGRARHNPKWRPWNGDPIPYGLMSPNAWPEDA